MNLIPEMDTTKVAIERLKAFEPKEGYYLAFSGGKDSQVIYHLALMAGVKFDAHYNVTTVDPPQLVKFIKRNYKEVKFELPELTMWELIPKKLMPPTRKVRYCCSELKEKGGKDRTVLTGVRADESPGRLKRGMYESCYKGHKKYLHPIIDWLDSDVWGFLKSNKIKYCELYNQGFDRLGCIGCPVQNLKNQKKDFHRWPTYKKKYIQAFEKMIEMRNEKKMNCQWKTGEEVMKWWLGEQKEDITKIEGGLFT